MFLTKVLEIDHKQAVKHILYQERVGREMH